MRVGVVIYCRDPVCPTPEAAPMRTRTDGGWREAWNFRRTERTRRRVLWFAVGVSCLAGGVGIATLPGVAGGGPTVLPTSPDDVPAGRSTPGLAPSSKPTVAHATQAPTSPGTTEVASASQDAVVELGRRLFFDPGASHSKSV